MRNRRTKELNYEKYKNAILFFLNNCNNNYLGRTKLNKLLYYLDFISFRDKKISVTGDMYSHLNYGPVPDNVESILMDMVSGKIIKVSETSSDDRVKYSFSTAKQPDMSKFSDYEKRLLADIASEFEPWTTQKIVDQTHLEAPWLFSKPYEKVDYKYSNDIEFFLEDPYLCQNA